MDTKFSPQDIEKKWYQFWQAQDLFSPKFSSPENNEAYCIMLPPPNITGTLHMGHAFQDTIMDLLIRYNRMQKKSTLWQPGTDHAGIATQMVVERQLEATGQKKEDLGRDKFLTKIWAWKEHSGGEILSQMQRLGASADWSRSRFTMDPDNCLAVNTAFVKLYEDGLIYRGERLVNWDPKLHTAISDLEVITTEEDGFLYQIKYLLENSNEYITIATSRPETIFADSAIAVHPDDTRYTNLIGKSVIIPLTERKITIIADKHAKMEFGTGSLKVTPAHDFNDYEIGKRHNLACINILTADALLNTLVPKSYQGLTPLAARPLVLTDLHNANLLGDKIPHKVTVLRGDRTGSLIEPYLTKQWFVHTKPLAIEAILAVEQNKIKFIPENWVNTYYSWMNDIQDWCISRQLWWGHQIPAWYDEQGNIYVGLTINDVKSKYNLSDNVILTQDPDVLDTWFSSALWPFATLGWPNKTIELNAFYPTNVLVTGFDIIFFWVARMIMFGLKFTGEVPFNTVYVHGLIQDAEGHKMSKSKGNVIDPIDIIDGISLDALLEKRTLGLMQPKMKDSIIAATKKHFPAGIEPYGTDALRFTLCAIASQNRHIRFDLQRTEGYRNFCNKIWNASRYVLMQTNEHELNLNLDTIIQHRTLADHWIVAILNQLKLDVNKHIAAYRFDLMAEAIYAFVWNEYCDWYLELAKPALKDGTEEQRNATRATLLLVLEEILRIMHPIMPFITEEIWQRIAIKLNKTNVSIMQEDFPQGKPIDPVDHKYIEAIEWLKHVITIIRNIRGEMNIPPNKPLTLLLQNANEHDRFHFDYCKNLICSIAKLSEINYIADTAIAPYSATAVMHNLKLFIPLDNIIDKEVEVTRLNKELEKTNRELTTLTDRLANENFTSKAKPELVAKEQARAKELINIKDKLADQLTALSGK